MSRWLAVLVLVAAARVSAAEPARFPSAVPLPMRVGVALVVNEVLTIEEAKGLFTAAVDVRIRWRDPRLAFDAKVEGLDRREHVGREAEELLRSIWTPEVMLANVVGTSRPPEIAVVVGADGSVTKLQRLIATFDTRYRLAAFPFDVQDLGIRVASSLYGRQRVVLVHDQADIDASGLRPGLQLDGWRVRRVAFSLSEARGLSGGSLSHMTASVRVERDPTPTIPIVFVPFVLLLFCASLTLWLDLDVDRRVPFLSSVILALIALNFTATLRFPALTPQSAVIQLFWIGFGYLWFLLVAAVSVQNPAFARFTRSSHLLAEAVAYLRWAAPFLLAVIGVRTIVVALV